MNKIKRFIQTYRLNHLIIPNEGNYQTHYFNKIGVAKYCDVAPIILSSDRKTIEPKDYAALKPFDLVYVTTSALPEWFETVYPRLLREGIRIFLVTGDAINSAPNAILSQVSSASLEQIISDGIILHWFTQNCDAPEHELMTPIPLGLDYHTLNRRKMWGEKRTPYLEQDQALIRLADNQRNPKAWQNKNPNVLVDFHHSLHANATDRNLAFEASKMLSGTKLLPARISRSQYWKAVRECQFVLSPIGAGTDCHRTWEAIVLGAVPIIRRTSISSLFEGLPIIEVNSYEELSDEMLQNYIYPDTLTEEAEQRLTLRYWLEVIDETKLRIACTA